MFEWLLVFLGGCDLVMVEVVCVDGMIFVVDVDDFVYVLVDKSLVLVVLVGDDFCFV